jgi:hypothetical protein
MGSHLSKEKWISQITGDREAGGAAKSRISRSVPLQCREKSIILSVSYLSKFFARIKKPGAYLVLVITGASDDGSSGSQPIHRQVLVLVLQLFGLQLSLSLSWLLWGFLRCENYYSVPKLLA